jgi:hypothetical protein
VHWATIPWAAWAALLWASWGTSWAAHLGICWAVGRCSAVVPSIYSCLQVHVPKHRALLHVRGVCSGAD